MDRTNMFEPVSEIEMLKRLVEQLERIVEDIRNPPVYGGYPKWFPPADVGGPYWLDDPRNRVVYQ